MMLYKQLADHCFNTNNPKFGVAKSAVDAHCKKLAPAIAALLKRENKQAAPLLDLPSRVADIPDIEKIAAEWRKKFTHIVVAGSGGSGLSGRALLRLKLMSTKPAFHFLENIDPHLMEDLLAHADLTKTGFLIISKSGTTVETLSQYHVLRERVEKTLGKKAVGENFIMITEPGDNPLRRSAADYGMRTFDHPSDIGGRFAILTVVGLLPAAIAGLDIKALRRGAQSVIAAMKSAPSPSGFAPALGAALQYAFIEKHIPMTVMLPYSEKLAGFSSWYRQNWAESLGKNGKGSTPIRAVGSTDQHSQLQLYLDGPRDKFFHMIMLERAGTGPRIEVPVKADLAYLIGKHMGDVMAAQQKATFETLVQHHCPVRLFTLPALTEEHLGALLMHFMVEIILTAHLLDVNPFDQPAVEHSKKLAREYLLTGNL